MLTRSQASRVEWYGIQFLEWAFELWFVGAIEFTLAGAGYRPIRCGLERANFILCFRRFVGYAHGIGIDHYFAIWFHKGIFSWLNVFFWADSFFEWWMVSEVSKNLVSWRFTRETYLPQGGFRFARYRKSFTRASLEKSSLSTSRLNQRYTVRLLNRWSRMASAKQTTVLHVGFFRLIMLNRRLMDLIVFCVYWFPTVLRRCAEPRDQLVPEFRDMLLLDRRLSQRRSVWR